MGQCVTSGGGHDGSAVDDDRAPRARDGFYVPVFLRLYYGAHKKARPERAEVGNSHLPFQVAGARVHQWVNAYVCLGVTPLSSFELLRRCFTQYAKFLLFGKFFTKQLNRVVYHVTP